MTTETYFVKLIDGTSWIGPATSVQDAENRASEANYGLEVRTVEQQEAAAVGGGGE